VGTIAAALLVGLGSLAIGVVAPSSAVADGCVEGDGGYRLIAKLEVDGMSRSANCGYDIDCIIPCGTRAPITGVARDPRGIGEWTLHTPSAVTDLMQEDFDHVLPLPTGRPSGIAATRSGEGVWIVGGDGAVFAYGDARYLGGANTIGPVAEIVDLASTPRGRAGYWLVGADGGVFTYGGARFFGSLGAVDLAAPIVDLVPTPTDRGYWLVAADGGVFAFGDAHFAGSAASLPLVAPVVGLAATDSGRGYWMLAADGGVFAFGDAPYLGRGNHRDASEPWAGIVS
jgi:hypothetical protein